MRARSPLRAGHSTYFGQLNCGKRSLVLDLKRPEAVAIAAALAAASDVLVENFRPGVMQRLGLDYATLSQRNARLVYCSISGFGQAGPAAGKPAYAPIVHAASGLDLAQLGYDDDRERPAKTGIFTADVLAGLNAFGAIATALFARQSTERGQFIDVTLIESMMNLLLYEVQEAQFGATQRRPVYGPLRATDGYVVVAAITAANFSDLADATGHPEWKIDPRFATAGAREQHWDDLMALVETWTAPRTAKECEDLLSSAGVPTSRYLTVREAMDDPGMAFRGTFARVEDGAGSFLVPNPPFQFSDATAAAQPFVATPGQHGEQILFDILGYARSEIAALRSAGVFGGAAPAG
jgi:crotonobetainyl-CoA:carnitine CoA-transferase CaiB-like acyl-CoA transferase